jgi:hypothetical protein
MDIIKNISNRIYSLLERIPEEIKEIPTAELEYKRAPEKWSKKEILGHLCDSAINNLSRFVRAQFEQGPFKIEPYAQDEWVKLNRYQETDIENILNYWVTLNNQIVNIISIIPEDKLGIVCDLGQAAFREGEIEKNLLWLIEDYVVHMEYHLRQITGAEWLRDEYGK